MREYFFGNKISDYGLKHGYVDYLALAKCFDYILNNNIISYTGWENWEQINGFKEKNEEEDIEIYQYFIISGYGAEILKNYTNEIVFYNEVLDMYIWGVTHWGTLWSHVLTDIKIE